MVEASSGDMVIGVLAAIGVVVLLVMFVYVVKQVLTRKE
jgi:hypothetical protein